MKELYPLKGIVTVLNTPFTDDDKIDISALRKNAGIALRAGVAGFLVPAMASEVYKLTERERLDMLEAVLEVAGGKVPVIAGAGEPDLSKCKKLLRSYIRLGCKNALFQIPFGDRARFLAHFMHLADTGPEMIMLQDWDASGYGLPDDVICELFERCDAFRCLKVETVPAGVKYSRIIELTHGRLNVSGGWAVTQMMEGLKRGVHAFMPTGMHHLYTTIYRHYMQGEAEKAEKLFHQVLPVLAFSNQHLDISIHFFKRLLYRQGIYNTPTVREPALPFDNIHREMADRLIDRIIALEESLESQ
jgi:dihydrodipicolinate synthase/N-acetylneuraminate lyase